MGEGAPHTRAPMTRDLRAIQPAVGRRVYSTFTLGPVLGALMVCGCGAMTMAESSRASSLQAPATASAEAPASTASPNYAHPVIADYGKALPMPDAAGQPDPDVEYQVVFDVTSKIEDPAAVHPGLDTIARFVNVYATAGVMPEQMELVGVVHGDATHAILSQEAYEERYGMPNPNAELLQRLRSEGVDLYVCGQALAHDELARQQVSGEVTVALAALTLVPTLQLRGFARWPV